MPDSTLQPTLPEIDPRDRYYWRNLIACLVVESIWGFAGALVTTTTIMAVFLERLGASKTVIGAYPGLLLLALALLQIPAARWIARFHRRLSAFIVIHVIPCSAWFVIAWFAQTWGLSHPRRLVWLVIGMNTLYTLLIGVIIPMWPELASRFFPDRRRGQAFGVMVMGIGLFGSLGAWYAQRQLDTLPFPDSFARIFWVAAAAMIIGLAPYCLCRETVPANNAPQPDQGRLGEWLAQRLWTDRRLMHLIASRCLFEIGASVGVFYAVYGIDRFHLSVSAAGTFTLLMSVSRTIVSPALGQIGDRRGYRRVTGWGMIFAAASTAMALIAPSAEWFYAVFIFQAILLNGDVIGVQNLLIEMCPEDDKTPYSAVFNTVMIPARFFAPILAGILADRASIPLVFALGLILQVAGWAYMLAFVDDPRRPGRRVLATALVRFNEMHPW